MDTFWGKLAGNRPAGFSGYLGRTGRSPYAGAAMSAHTARCTGGPTRPQRRHRGCAGVGFRTARTQPGVELPMDVSLTI